MPELATPTDWYMALAYTVRDRIMNDWVNSIHRMRDQSIKIVGYLSAEFLLGPHLGNNLLNLGMREQARAGRLPNLGSISKTLLGEEEEPGLGNGGLGRLAACYLDSLATLRSSGHRLRHPLRVRHLRPGDPRRLAGGDDRQVAALGNPWEICPAGDRLPRQRSAATPSSITTSRAVCGCAGCRHTWSRALPTTRRSCGYRAGTDQLPPAVEIGGGRILRLPGLQRRRLLRGGRRRRCSPRTSARCSIPTTSPRPASSCAWRSSTSSSPARCRT